MSGTPTKDSPERRLPVRDILITLCFGFILATFVVLLTKTFTSSSDSDVLQQRFGTLPLEEPCEVLIVGAGIAGAYHAHRLASLYPAGSICIVESENRIGGRMYDVATSDLMDKDYTYTGKIYALGAEQVVEGQTTYNLTKELGIDLVKNGGNATALERKGLVRTLFHTRGRTFRKMFRFAPADLEADLSRNKNLTCTNLQPHVDSYANVSCNTTDSMDIYSFELNCTFASWPLVNCTELVNSRDVLLNCTSDARCSHKLPVNGLTVSILNKGVCALHATDDEVDQLFPGHTCKDFDEDRLSYSNVSDLVDEKMSELYADASYASMEDMLREVLINPGMYRIYTSMGPVYRGDFPVGFKQYVEYSLSDANMDFSLAWLPVGGMSTIPKRMIHHAQQHHGLRLYLGARVQSLDEFGSVGKFFVQTADRLFVANRVVVTTPPSAFREFHGSVPYTIQQTRLFRSILPVDTAILMVGWPYKWWTNLTDVDSDVPGAKPPVGAYRSLIAAESCFNWNVADDPYSEEETASMLIVDEKRCVDHWRGIDRMSQNPKYRDAMKEKIQLEFASFFPNVSIPAPDWVFAHFWDGGWHYTTAGSLVTSADIEEYALAPIPGKRISLAGESYYVRRSGWSDAAVKSSMRNLVRNFAFDLPCVEDPTALDGQFCP